MSSKSKPNHAATLAELQALISGLQKQLPSGSFTLVPLSLIAAR